jgi:hypothetical protein
VTHAVEQLLNYEATYYATVSCLKVVLPTVAVWATRVVLNKRVSRCVGDYPGSRDVLIGTTY